MAKGYVIFIETIKDQATYDGYVQKAVPTVMQQGGKPIVFHDNADELEGKWPGVRTVVLEFDSPEAAKKWYESSEYQAVMGERHASADAIAAILPGTEPPAS